jgi:hypothetical protein
MNAETIGVALLVAFLIFITARGSLPTYIRLLFAGNPPKDSSSGSGSSGGSGSSMGGMFGMGGGSGGSSSLGFGDLNFDALGMQ